MRRLMLESWAWYAILGGFARDLSLGQRVIEAALADAHGRGAEGNRQRNRIGADGERHGTHRVAQLVADRAGPVERAVGEEDREAVAGQTTDHGIAAREVLLQRMRHCGDHLVAGFEAEQIVDDMELVDVTVQDRRHCARAARAQAPLDEFLDATARQQAGHGVRGQRDDFRQLVGELADGARVFLAESRLLHRAEDQHYAGELRFLVLDPDRQEAAEQRAILLVAHAIADDRLGSVTALEQKGIRDVLQDLAHVGGIGSAAVEFEVVARGRCERDGVTRHALLRFEEKLPDRRGR